MALQRLKRAVRYGLVWLAIGLVIAGASWGMRGGRLPEQPFDSAVYFNHADAFEHHGRFTLKQFPASFRGYFYPLVLYALRVLMPFATVEQQIWLFNSGLMAGLLLWLTLRLWHKREGKARLFAPVAMLTLMLLYWPDLCCYALTDLPALVALLGCTVLMYRDSVQKDTGGGIVTGLVSGGLCYFVYNMRPNYSVSCYLLLAGNVYLLLRRPKRAFGWMFLMGLGVAALPQVYINRCQLGTWSPMVQVASYMDEGLAMTYLFYGLMFRRYETFAGSAAQYPPGQMLFDNPYLHHLMEQENVTVSSGLGGYIGFLLTHPFECLAAFVEHAVNLLTPLFCQIYVTNVQGIKMPALLLNYVLFAVALLNALLRSREKRCTLRSYVSHPLFPVCLLSLLPVLIALPGDVEVRYALALYLLLYVYLAWYVDYGRLWRAVRKHPVLILGTLLFGAAVYICILSNTFAGLQNLPLRML